MEVHHVGYLVKEIAPALPAFRALGYAPLKGNPPPLWDEARRAHFLFLRSGVLTVELVAPAPDSPIYPLYKTYRASPYHICYRCENLASEIARLREAKFLLFLPPAPAPAISPRARVAFLQSARAGMVELLSEEDSSAGEETAAGDVPSD